MNTVYTTTITREAKRRGIGIEVIDADTPIFLLKYGGRSIRCYNALTDAVGAVTFHLAQDKRLANVFLARYGFSVPRQIKYTGLAPALAFLRRVRSVVVKPCREWGGRGVAVGVTREQELREALARARRFGEDVVIEECVEGVDHRLIFVDYRCVAAIVREPATVVGNGTHTLRELIVRQNARERRTDASHRIPLDAETRRALAAAGLDYDHVPRAGETVRVRLTSNYHTGGSVREVTDSLSESLVRAGRNVARLFQVPVLGVDFLVHPRTGRHWIIEVSPDLAISPPEGETVARCFLDLLFPETAAHAAAAPARRARLPRPRAGKRGQERAP